MVQTALRLDGTRKATRRKGAGRPRKAPADRIAHQVNIRFDGELYDALTRAAFDTGQTLAQAARSLLRQAIL